MLTREENELLTRVGPGTPMGELLRRYWHPVAPWTELTDEQPTRFVRVLGEDLVLFRDKSGREGLIGDHCPHRGASMLQPFKTPSDALHPFARFRMDMVLAQDHMAWETQGPIADRTIERLATSDRGIVLYRELLMENIERVQRGLDPFAVVRDQDHAMIAT